MSPMASGWLTLRSYSCVLGVRRLAVGQVGDERARLALRGPSVSQSTSKSSTSKVERLHVVGGEQAARHEVVVLREVVGERRCRPPGSRRPCSRTGCRPRSRPAPPAPTRGRAGCRPRAGSRARRETAPSSPATTRKPRCFSTPTARARTSSGASVGACTSRGPAAGSGCAGPSAAAGPHRPPVDERSAGRCSRPARPSAGCRSRRTTRSRRPRTARASRRPGSGRGARPASARS